MLKISVQNYFLPIAILAFSSSVISKEISYDYVQGTYNSISDSSVPGIEVDADGFGVSGSFSVAPNIAVNASYETRSYDKVLGLDIDFTAFTFGLTAHTSITPETDIFGNFSVLKVEGEMSDGFTTISDDDTGNTISVGLRHIINNDFEFNISLTHEDIYDDTANISEFGIRFYASDKFSIGIGYSVDSDDLDTILLNARFDFK